MGGCAKGDGRILNVVLVDEVGLVEEEDIIVFEEVERLDCADFDHRIEWAIPLVDAEDMVVQHDQVVSIGPYRAFFELILLHWVLRDKRVFSGGLDQFLELVDVVAARQEDLVETAKLVDLEREGALQAEIGL